MRVITSLAAALSLAVAGCGGSDGPPRHAASGRVTLDGTPLDDASIVFEPQGEGGLVASAAIVDGRFQWTEENGPAAGDYHVRVNPDAVEESEALAIVQQKKRQSIEKVQVPARYQRPGALSATVSPDGPNEFEFPLKSR
jgi:hypothetical protein